MSYPNPAPAAPPRMGLQESLERLLHSHRLLTRDIEFVATTRGTMSWPMFCDAARELHVHVVRDGGYRPSEVITPLLVMGRDFWAELWYDNACGVWVWKLMCKPALPRMSRLKRVEHAVHAVKADVLAKPPPPMQAADRDFPRAPASDVPDHVALNCRPEDPVPGYGTLGAYSPSMAASPIRKTPSSRETWNDEEEEDEDMLRRR